MQLSNKVEKGPRMLKMVKYMSEQEKHQRRQEPTEEFVPFLSFLFFFSAWVAWAFCYYFYLRRLWEVIPKEFARTTPGKAAGFALIPYFTLIWNFIAFWGLYRDMNKATKFYGHGTTFNATLILMICIGWGILALFPVYSSAMLSMEMAPLRDMIPGEIPGEEEVMLFMERARKGLTVPLYCYVLNAIVTLPTYWLIRKNVLEFIDIKTSVGQ